MIRSFIITALLIALPAQGQEGFSINMLNDAADSRFFDQTINAFMDKHGIPGLSIAIARQGDLIFARGYGLADKDQRRSVGIADQFRIASLSKPITAVAIMELVENGELSLDDRVFGTGGILQIPYPSTNRHVDSITIKHLLEHTAASEWSNDNNDPMFAYPALGKRALVQEVLNERILASQPGTQYSYSNLGYCILGLVIEARSGKIYEEFVKENIFTPINARSFAIADNIPSKTFPEVRYYQDNEDPYGFPIQRMDAHGGWKANATDLVLFSLGVDGLAQPPDILESDTIRLMSEASAANSNYALGWNVNASNNRWHIGTLPGTAAILVRTESGYSWAVLMNKRGTDPDFLSELDALPWTLVNSIKEGFTGK